MKTGVLNRLGVARRAGQLALLLCALPPALQAQFDYKVEDGSVTITRYTGSGVAVTIPDTIQGLPVTSIGNAAFAGAWDRPNTSLTSITVPDSVTSIGDWAFSYCTGLTNITIPDSVTSIGEGAFAACGGLTSIMIPNSVTSIGDWAFNGCTGLTSITIPDSITGIGIGAFNSCTGLTNIVIPDSVTSIRQDTFNSCTGLTSITIADSVTSIGEWAFAFCSGLASVTIPDSVTSIGEGAFAACAGLTNVYFEGEPLWTGSTLFEGTPAIIYYLPESTGWGPTYSERPTVLWLPRIETYGCHNDQFVCTVRWGGHRTVALEACTDLAKPSWSSVATNTLFNSTASFTDPESAVRPASFYRVREITPPRGGVTVTGEVGEVYVIESATDPESTFWLTRGWVELTAPTVVWQDPIPPSLRERVYRSVKVANPTFQTVPNMVWIPPGRFVMGSPETERGRGGNEGPQTRVELTKGFWIGKCEVTVGEYFAVMGPVENPCMDPQNPGELDRPVFCVSWDDAVEYCQALSEQERGAGRLPEGWEYRLPTEAEWEYACRAGTTTRFSFGDALGCGDGSEYCPLLDLYMWWCGNWRTSQIHPVGSKLPNPWGLYDMHGNVAEWCHDWWGDYAGGGVVDPQGPARGSVRVIRGGLYWGVRNVWFVLAGYCRSASRGNHDPDLRSINLGFRVLLAQSQ